MKNKRKLEIELLKKISERAKEMESGHTINYLLNISKECLERELKEEKEKDS